MKHWLYRRFLPEWCRQELLEENSRLADEIRKQEQEIRQLKAYISGMQTALRLGKRVTIVGSEKAQ